MIETVKELKKFLENKNEDDIFSIVHLGEIKNESDLEKFQNWCEYADKTDSVEIVESRLGNVVIATLPQKNL